MPLPPALTSKLDSRCAILGVDRPLVAAMPAIGRAMVAITIERIEEMMRMAPETAYRPMLCQQMIRALVAIDEQRPAGERPSMSPRDRARLLMLRRPLPDDIDEERVRRYVVGVALGLPVDALAERAAGTVSAELIARFLRSAGPFSGHDQLVDVRRVAEIMEA